MDMEKQFKEELFSLLKKYQVEMSVEFDYKSSDARGINFWQYATPPGLVYRRDQLGINFTLGLRTDGYDGVGPNCNKV